MQPDQAINTLLSDVARRMRQGNAVSFYPAFPCWGGPLDGAASLHRPTVTREFHYHARYEGGMVYRECYRWNVATNRYEWQAWVRPNGYAKLLRDLYRSQNDDE